MTGWQDLDDELDAWARAGAAATFWWRDDDAIEPTPQLDRLLELARATAARPAPLCLAVIPSLATAELGGRLAECGQVCVLQHGYAHANHAPPPARKVELGPHRPLELVLAEIRAGGRRLAELFPKCGMPVLVPPWNRIDPAVTRRLSESGIRGLSAYGARRALAAAPGVSQVNAHVDIVDWRRGGGFVGEAAALGLLVGHLAARRLNQVDPSEPTGLLTHHLVHDESAWRFLASLLERSAGRTAVRWLAGSDVFGHGPPAAHVQIAS